MADNRPPIRTALDNAKKLISSNNLNVLSNAETEYKILKKCTDAMKKVDDKIVRTIVGNPEV